MKGQFTLALLNIIGSASLNTAQVFEAVVRAGYGASMGKIDREYSKIDKRNRQLIGKLIADVRLRERYYKTLSHLLQDGLLERQKGGVLRVTTLGVSRRDILRRRSASALPGYQYPRVPTAEYVIVAFDIPEKERTRRLWLRNALRSIGLQMIQHSVWAGRVRIPRALLSDLRDLKMLDYVEIFAITRKGTLKHLA